MSAHHGNTPAAWTGVAVVLVGFVVGGLGLVVGSMLLFWIGVALGPVGGLAGLAMSKAGYGEDEIRNAHSGQEAKAAERAREATH